MWTKELPTEAGHYWYRKNKYKAECMVCVFVDYAESLEKENEERSKNQIPLLSRYESVTSISNRNLVFYTRFSSGVLCDKLRLSTFDGEWQGPLTPSDKHNDDS